MTVAKAFEKLAAITESPSDGNDLEEVTREFAPKIKELDVSSCYTWANWPDRTRVFPKSTEQDIGIDLIALRRSDGGYVAIQCKSRAVKEDGTSTPIQMEEVAKFDSASQNEHFVERWLVSNTGATLTSNAIQSMSMADEGRKLRQVNITEALRKQDEADKELATRAKETHVSEYGFQTRQEMQDEVVEKSVRTLKEYADSNSGGSPLGQARGKIILPCGTGKTRISLRIVEQLAEPGDVSIVLCPSIALVAQIRGEYLRYTEKTIRALAVCSDKTAGYNHEPERDRGLDSEEDPTEDFGYAGESSVTGLVTTDSGKIAEWMQVAKDSSALSVIFGTYQSGHKISEALLSTGITAKVMIGDEAHRTAGIQKFKYSGKIQDKIEERDEKNKSRRRFALCHDQKQFPVMYRIYQTATPKVYKLKDGARKVKDSDLIVRSMDDEDVFGVELYRRSYVDAVENAWLSDYYIIALGVRDDGATDTANILSRETESKKLKTKDYLSALAFALVMGGATSLKDGELANIDIRSCIAFMNSVERSKDMAKDLQSEVVRDWVQKHLEKNYEEKEMGEYKLEHVDASSSVLAREAVKSKLANATTENPYGVLNVGIFGEGTDSPSLSAVAFLDPRKSPIDVIQAVGRVMRTAPGKKRGYIICPILFPPTGDAEEWLKTSTPEQGWQELGQILCALRAHDERIEDNLPDRMMICVTNRKVSDPVFCGLFTQSYGKIRYFYHMKGSKKAQEAMEAVIEKKRTPKQVGLFPASNLTGRPRVSRGESVTKENVSGNEMKVVLTVKELSDGTTEAKIGGVKRKPAKKTDPEREGAWDEEGTRKVARGQINKGKGQKVPHSSKRKKRRTGKEMSEVRGQQMIDFLGVSDDPGAICVSLLENSGLQRSGAKRDFNILRESIGEAKHYLDDDGLLQVLNKHFNRDKLKERGARESADGCMIASLLLMNAMMLHQRIANGGWLSDPIVPLSEIKTEVKNVTSLVLRQWEKITRHDFVPIIDPALEVVYVIQDSGRQHGLEKTLRYLASEASRIAEVYASMGVDYAGELFNKVMGNQSSDGAFFTRPMTASLAARLTLDVCGEQDWTEEQVWRDHKMVDLACGSGTLLTAMLSDMKRRAKEQGANESRIARLQKVAVEDTIKGLDINPVSLQLAASQLTMGNTNIRYEKMGLWKMPYGPDKKDDRHVSVGTLELLGQQSIVPRSPELFKDAKIESEKIWGGAKS